ncbi:MAG TPA: AtpZ/AtpI family protein [Syntrophorhabdales bacterium]|nr:AtpZ/AtpI family protein [Syntrophorhabdales bacterium]
MAKSDKPKANKREAFNSFLSYGALGLEMGLCVAIGLAAGLYLDRRFETTPILTLVFLGFGLAAAMKAIYRTWKKAERESDSEQ